MIPLTEVQGSSQIAAVGHDPATNTLAVRFHTGAVYHYDNVPADQHAAFMASDSKGKFFGAHIKDRAEFPHKRVVDAMGAKQE